MGKLLNKDILQTIPPSLQVKQLAGWSWYCPYHDTMGSGDTKQEVLFIAGAHMYYHEPNGDNCDIITKKHTVVKEKA
jgi:hypothetical protein